MTIARRRALAREVYGVQVLALFDHYQAEHGRRPTEQEIADALGITLRFARLVTSPLWHRDGARRRRYTVRLPDRTRTAAALVSTYSEEIMQLYATGTPPREIGKIVGLCAATVTRVIVASGGSSWYARFRRRWRLAERQDIRSRFAAGETTQQIGDRYRVSPRAIDLVVLRTESEAAWGPAARQALDDLERGMTTSQVAAKYRRSFKAVEKLKARAKQLEPTSTGPYTSDEIEKALAMKSARASKREIAAALGRSIKSVDKFFARQKGKT
jgi:hypothetical protein